LFALSRDPHEGRIAIVTDVGRGMRWTLAVRKDEAPRSGRQSRVVLAPRRWRELLKKLSLLRGDGDNKPDRRRERGISRKTIAQGKPDRVRWTCGDLLVCFFILHARLRVQRTPGFPCALC